MMLNFGVSQLFSSGQRGCLQLVCSQTNTLKRSIHELSLSSKIYLQSTETLLHTGVPSIVRIPGICPSCKMCSLSSHTFNPLDQHSTKRSKNGREHEENRIAVKSVNHQCGNCRTHNLRKSVSDINDP